MSGVAILVGGGLVLLACGVMAVGQSAQGRADRQQLAARLETLQAPDSAAHSAADRRRGASRDIVRHLPRPLQIMFARADIAPSLDHAAMLSAGIAGSGALILLWLGWVAALVSMLVAVAVGFLILKIVAARRIWRFAEELPSFLDSIRQMLITGNSVQQAIVKASDNAGETARRYLRPMIRRMQNGGSVGESVAWLADRLNMLELHMFATAIQTNIRYGGRLSNILLNLVAVLRDRARVFRELKAATAETRMSAIVLGLLPIAAAFFITMTNPTYIEFFTNTVKGNHLLISAITFQIIGVLAMRWLMRVDY